MTNKVILGACAVGATALAVYDGGLAYGLVCGAMGGATYLISEGQAKELDKALKEVKAPSLYAQFKAQREEHHGVSAMIGITTILCPLLGVAAIVGQAVVKTAVTLNQQPLVTEPVA